MSYFLCRSGSGCACCTVPIFRLFPCDFPAVFFRSRRLCSGRFFRWGLCRLSCSRLWILCCDSEFSQVYSAAFAVPASLRYLCRISGCDRGSRKDAVFSAGHSVVFVVLVFRQERFRLCGGVVLQNSPVSDGRRQSASVPGGIPVHAFFRHYPTACRGGN